MEYRGGILMANSDLYHHGILGQKWGRRNGPPYPLSGSAHSSAENKAGWKKSLNKTSNTGVITDTIRKRHVTNVIKKLDKKRIKKGSLNKYENLKRTNAVTELAKIEEREFARKPLEEREKIWKEEQSKYFKENKEKLLKDAKEKDLYDLEFLERTPDEWSKKPLKEQLKDYEKYIDSNIIKVNEEASGSAFSKKNKKNPDAKAIAQERLKTIQTENPALYEAKKQTALQKGKASDVLQFKGNLTNQQLQDAVNRIRLEQTLSEYSSKEVQSNWDKIDKAMSRLNQVNNWTTIAVNSANNIDRIIKMIDKK